jgi:UDP-N-acetylglucosamine--N-acetylmuramyl-(pentapeptide) pyrophosphoryl-undecaprenol N-acetylglucosamine transferase
MHARTSSPSPAPRSAVLVANTGGHLRELHELRPRLGLDRVAWLTFDDSQSRSLLVGEEVHHLRWTGSRDYANTLRNIGHAFRHFREHEYDAVVSTGAAVALSVLPVARGQGLGCHYIESATRTAGPSMTGRLMAVTPGVHRYTQYAGWAGSRWAFSGSVFDGFASAPRRAPVLRKVVVTLGTMRQWSFRCAVERLVQVLPRDAEVVWQTGHTDVRGLPLHAQSMLTATDLARHMREADLVIAHAGVGSSLDALASGHRPLLLPRRAMRAEHIDDHQEAIAHELVARGLAVTAEAPEVTLDHLLDAAAQGVDRVQAPAFRLVDEGVRARPRV